MTLACAVMLLLLAPQPADWMGLDWLAGEWIGEGGGGPGQGAGAFSFTRELDGNVLVRRSRAAYPATRERAAFVHEDLMVVYREGDRVRAVFFDNERHVIRYAVEATAAQAVFLSDAEAGAPRFRLTYFKTGPDRVRLKFEIAPPGRPGVFSTYIEAAARRK